MICKELNAENAEQKQKEKKLKDLDEVEKEKENKHAWDKCINTKRTQENFI